MTICTLLAFSQPASWGSHLECISINRCALSYICGMFFLIGKIPYHGKIISNKQRETTVHHYLKTWRSVNPEHFKKALDGLKKLWWNWLMRTATGKEDPELPLLQRISSLELTEPQIAAQINAMQSSSNRHISTSTVQRRLRESGLRGQIAAKKPLLKDTNKKRLAWAKKHKQWTLDQSFGRMSPNLRFLVPTVVSLWDAE